LSARWNSISYRIVFSECVGCRSVQWFTAVAIYNCLSLSHYPGAVSRWRLKTYLFRRCYETARLWMTFPFPSHYLPSRTVRGPCNSFHRLGHSKKVYDDDDELQWLQSIYIRTRVIRWLTMLARRDDGGCELVEQNRSTLSPNATSATVK